MRYINGPSTRLNLVILSIGDNNGYEKIIDDASNQIEEFITKNNFS